MASDHNALPAVSQQAVPRQAARAHCRGGSYVGPRLRAARAICFLARRRMYSDRERRGRQDHQHGAVHAWQLGVGEAPHTRSRYSFSTAFVPAFDGLVQDGLHSVIVTSAWGASPVPEVPNEGRWDKANGYYWGTVVPGLVDKLMPGDAVFLVNDMASFSPHQVTADDSTRLTHLKEGLARMSAALAARSIDLFMLHGIPFAREAKCDPQSAAKQWFAPSGGPCTFYSKADTVRRRAHLDRTLTALEADGILTVVDLMEVFCVRENCTYDSADGQMLYRDVWSHPSVEAARLAGPIIQDALRRR